MDEPLTLGQVVELTDALEEAAAELIDTLENRPDMAGEAYTAAKAVWWSYVKCQAEGFPKVDPRSDEAAVLAAAAQLASCVDSMIDAITEFSGDTEALREGCRITAGVIERYAVARTVLAKAA